jgi:hypothetical protein
MNIRSVSNPITPVEVNRASESRNVKTDVSSEDRDANGKREEKEPDKNPLSDEEMKKAKEYIESLSGLKANGLKLEIEHAGDYRVFVIRDHDGRVARRIIEWEVRLLLETRDKKTGQIFDKAA